MENELKIQYVIILSCQPKSIQFSYSRYLSRMIKHYTAKFLKLFAKNCNFWDQMQSSFLFLFFLFDVFGLNFLGGIFSFNFLSPPYASCQFSTALIQYVFPASENNSAISRYVHLGANNHI